MMIQNNKATKLSTGLGKDGDEDTYLRVLQLLDHLPISKRF
jgi:hypothetical protein